MGFAGKKRISHKKNKTESFQGVPAYLGSNSVAGTDFICWQQGTRSQELMDLESELSSSQVTVTAPARAQTDGYSHYPDVKAHRQGEDIGLTYCLLNVGECVFFGQKEREKDHILQQGRVVTNK